MVHLLLAYEFPHEIILPNGKKKNNNNNKMLLAGYSPEKSYDFDTNAGVAELVGLGHRCHDSEGYCSSLFEDMPEWRNW